MVPVLDMANHAAGEETVALYETDMEGNAVLQLREGKTVKAGEEITITYVLLMFSCSREHYAMRRKLHRSSLSGIMIQNF